MKALSLWQPWASLIALGEKTIETRGWSTRYRGPLAIHAAKRRPETMRLGDWWCEPVWGKDFGLLNEVGQPHQLPLGAVVATCTLVDVVPMRTNGDPTGNHCLVIDRTDEGDKPHQRGGLWLIGNNALTYGRPTWVEDQRPFGAYEPGRYAWLLADVTPLGEPIPMTGHQGLWHIELNKETTP